MDAKPYQAFHEHNWIENICRAKAIGALYLFSNI